MDVFFLFPDNIDAVDESGNLLNICLVDDKLNAADVLQERKDYILIKIESKFEIR